MKQIQVLLADDRPTERADIVECLNRDPLFCAEECDLSSEAVKRATNARNYDLLLLDVEQRVEVGQDKASVDQTFGLKILEELHQDLHDRGMKIVLLTIHDIFVPGSKVANMIRAALDRGYADAHMRKPFVPSHHAALLTRIVQGPTSERAQS